MVERTPEPIPEEHAGRHGAPTSAYAGRSLRSALVPWRRLVRRGGGRDDARAVDGPDTGARPEPVHASGWGTVVLPFGRYFAGRADLLTRERYKTTEAVLGLSPLTVVGEPDPAMVTRFLDSDGFGDGRDDARVRADVLKDLDGLLAGSGAAYLVVDNTTALMQHRWVDGRLYTLLPDEQTPFMQMLRTAEPSESAPEAFKVSRVGLDGALGEAYDRFVAACLSRFAPERIILVRSHAAHFFLDADGRVVPTDVDRADARLLAELDDRFARATGCRVAVAALSRFPAGPSWQAPDDAVREALEAELVALMRSEPPAPPVSVPSVSSAPPVSSDGQPLAGVADLALGWVRGGPRPDRRAVRAAAKAGVTYDDLLGLVLLEQEDPETYAGVVRRCLRDAVAQEDSLPVHETRARFERSVAALAAWPHAPRLAPAPAWQPQIALTCGDTVLRFGADGSLTRLRTDPVAEQDLGAIASGSLPLTPRTVGAALRSWPLYLERGRQRMTAAPTVVVHDVAELVDTCAWLDWEDLLTHERLVVATGRRTRGRGGRGEPRARTDLGFLFDPDTRVCTVAGGLMDQVAYVALFDSLCTPEGLRYVVDDTRYLWWPTHNGFEAARLAPELEERRLTRRISQPLRDAFRAHVSRVPRLPWVFSQSRAWVELGLREAVVVTLDMPNARLLQEAGPTFPVLVHDDPAQLPELVRNPPGAVTFVTTQQRLPMEAASADLVRHVFDFRHLEAAGLPPVVERTAALLRGEPHVALHVRRGDFLDAHFDVDGWHGRQSHYARAIEHLVTEELGSRELNLAVFSDDLAFVAAHPREYGLDEVTGEVRLIEGNRHFDSIYDSYLMALCPVVVGSVGFFASSTSLLADPPSTFLRALPDGVRVEWRR